MTNITVREERMNGHFVKYHIEGLPFPLVLHQFTGADGDEADPHDHPFPVTSFILHGGYTEQQFRLTSPDPGYPIEKDRPEGTAHRVEAGDVHRITRLHGHETWTAIIPGQHERTPGFYKFCGPEIRHSYHFEQDEEGRNWSPWPRQEF